MQATNDLSGRSPASTDKHDAWIIWLHGLGESGHALLHLQSVLGYDMPWVKWSFPEAAIQSVTANGGTRMRSWFDVTTLPITPSQDFGLDGEVRTCNSALREPTGLGPAVSAVHAMLTQAESMGYKSTRIILGGVSQGGALALLAARLYPRPLGGVISLSGWHLRPYYRPSDTPNHATPIMLCHGVEDEIVPIACMHESLDLLRASGHRHVTHHCHPSAGHDLGAAAHAHIRSFLMHHLPPPAPVEDLLSATPVSNAPVKHKTVVKMGGRRTAAAASNAVVMHGPPPQPPPSPMLTSSDKVQSVPALSDTQPPPPPSSKPSQPPSPETAQHPPAFSVREADAAVEVVVVLPHVQGMAGLDLRVGVAGLELDVTDRTAGLGPLHIAWPRAVDEAAVRARFIRKAGELRITAPYLL